MNSKMLGLLNFIVHNVISYFLMLQMFRYVTYTLNLYHLHVQNIKRYYFLFLLIFLSWTIDRVIFRLDAPRESSSFHNKTEAKRGKENETTVKWDERWVSSARIPAFRVWLFRLIGTAWINLIPPFSTGGAFLFSTPLRISSPCPFLRAF